MVCMILSTRHHHPTQEQVCYLCQELIPIGARAVRVSFRDTPLPGHYARTYTQRYHNRCWVREENRIKATHGELVRRNEANEIPRDEPSRAEVLAEKFE